MKLNLRTGVILAFVLFFVASLAYADEQLDKETLETLIKGNTVEGKKIKWKTTYKMYFDPSGKYRRIDSLDNQEGGKWRVEDNGRLIMQGRKENKENQRIVKQRSDGGYDVYDRSGELIWTMDKVLQGNPYNLVPPSGSF